MNASLKQVLESAGRHLKALSIYGRYWGTGLDGVPEAQTALKSLYLELSWPKKQLGRPLFPLERFSGRARVDEDIQRKAVISCSNPLGLPWRCTRSRRRIFLQSKISSWRSSLLCGSWSSPGTSRTKQRFKPCWISSRAVPLSVKWISAARTTSRTQVEGIDLPRRFPPFLKDIVMAFLPFTTTYLLEVLADNRCLRDLKMLGLDHSPRLAGDQMSPRPRSPLRGAGHDCDSRQEARS